MERDQPQLPLTGNDRFLAYPHIVFRPSRPLPLPLLNRQRVGSLGRHRRSVKSSKLEQHLQREIYPTSGKLSNLQHLPSGNRRRKTLSIRHPTLSQLLVKRLSFYQQRYYRTLSTGLPSPTTKPERKLPIPRIHPRFLFSTGTKSIPIILSMGVKFKKEYSPTDHLRRP